MDEQTAPSVSDGAAEQRPDKPDVSRRRFGLLAGASALALPGIVRAADAPAVSIRQLKAPRPAKDVDHGIVYRRENEFASHPYTRGFWETAAGHLICNFSVSTVDYSGDPNRLAHTSLVQGVGGRRGATVRSEDRGRTWRVVDEDPRRSSNGVMAPRPGIDGRPGPISEIGPVDFLNRDVLVSNTNYLYMATDPLMREFFADVSQVLPSSPASHVFFRISKDAGQSWSRSAALPLQGLSSLQGTESATVRPDGRCLLFLIGNGTQGAGGGGGGGGGAGGGARGGAGGGARGGAGAGGAGRGGAGAGAGGAGRGGAGAGRGGGGGGGGGGAAGFGGGGGAPGGFGGGNVGNRPLVYASTDDGTGFHFLSYVIPRDVSRYAGLSMMYPRGIMLPSGRLLCAFRLDRDWAGDMWTELHYSDDGGGTWAFRSRVGDFGAPCAPLRLSDGRLVMICGNRLPPIGIRAIVSEDEGRTWGPEIVVRDDAGSWDIGYPRAWEVSPGRVGVVYYYNTKDDPVQVTNPNVLQPWGAGGVRFIARSFFSVD